MYRTLVQMFDERVASNPLYTAQLSKDEKAKFHPTTYIQLQEKVRSLASSLKKLGLRRGEIVGLMSDNRAEWMVADLAVLALGAADAPRGRDAMDYEIRYILFETDARFCFAENLEMAARIIALKPGLPRLETVIVMDASRPAADSGTLDELRRRSEVSVLLQDDLVRDGGVILDREGGRKDIEHEIVLGSEEDICTIIFTSGTTGDPKGVMLTHANILYQLAQIPSIKKILPQQRWLAVLPVWHSFERLIQYVILDNLDIIAYSKPIGKIMLIDMAQVKPHYICSVPRIWETVKAGVNQNLKSKTPFQRKMFNFFLSAAKKRYRAKELVHGMVPDITRRFRAIDWLCGIIPYLALYPIVALGRKAAFGQITSKFGPDFVGGISGGGSMSKDVQTFFSAIGVTLIDGYGLTETAPLVGAQNFDHPTRGFMFAMKGTEIKCVKEDGTLSAPGEKGVLYVRGPQVMKGYFKRPDLTEKVIDKDGWFNTGDLAIMTRSGLFCIAGRAKDTIVLSGGENIEPVPIEAALNESEYIETAVVVGQDRKYLGALLVIAEKNVERYLKDMKIPYVNREGLAEMEEVRALINREIQEKVSSKRGFKAFEQINRFALLEKSFKVGEELSAKQELKRHRINELYARQIDGLFR